MTEINRLRDHLRELREFAREIQDCRIPVLRGEDGLLLLGEAPSFSPRLLRLIARMNGTPSRTTEELAARWRRETGKELELTLGSGSDRASFPTHRVSSRVVPTQSFSPLR